MLLGVSLVCGRIFVLLDSAVLVFIVVMTLPSRVPVFLVLLDVVPPNTDENDIMIIQHAILPSIENYSHKGRNTELICPKSTY